MGSTQRRQRTEYEKHEPVHDEAAAVSFGVFSSKEIKELSACHVTNPMAFNNLGQPAKDGLYDLRMGPFTDRGELQCATCLLFCEHCPGHLGHIELPLPVCNPLFYNTILRLLKMTCLTCHRFRIVDHLKRLYLVQQRLLDRGLIIQAQQATEVVVAASGNGGSAFAFDDGEEKAAKKALKQSIDTALIMAKLDKFMNETIQEADNVDEISNTRSVESLRKGYNKDFLNQNTKSGQCPNCGAITKSVVFYRSRFIYEGFKLNEDDENTPNIGQAARRKRKMGDREKTELNPKEIQQHFRELWALDSDILANLFPMLRNDSCEFPTDLFFIEALGVPPPKTRPCQFMSGMMTLHPQSTGLQNVLETVTILKQVLQVASGNVSLELLSPEAQELVKSLKGDSPILKMDLVWKELQQHVDHVLDRDMNRGSNNKGNTWGFKQLIERKQGLFRMNMMGKRVNFAARTVITPDPNLAIDEIGLPEVFAKKLTYRVPVTPWNVEEMRQAVINGPEVHPGAVCVEAESGKRTFLKPNDPADREAVAKTLLTPGVSTENPDGAGAKYVHRHLKNGDPMLLNRQPSLHKPSIMSHRARVLKGHKVMRLHYAICKSYNADFDGDEMNAHFPQNEVARSEATNLVNVCKQYLVPKDGTPLQGLIQDHIIAGVKMTIRGRFFTREQYQQFVFYALVDHPGEIKTLPPAIVKPGPFWSGKQIISTIIMNLVPKKAKQNGPTLHMNSKIKDSEWQKHKPKQWQYGGTPLPFKKEQGPTMSESEVVFRNGEFLTGILDKNQYGATQYGLVHSFFELYGGTYSGKLLSAFSKIFTNFLHTEGFTLGVRDILVQDDANVKRKQIMMETRMVGKESATDGVGIKPEEKPEDDQLYSALEVAHRESRKIPKRRMDIDRAYKERLSQATNKVNGACMPKGLVATFPNNNLQLMVQAGAKGSSVNTMQISCLLGQIELEGKRPPLMISGKPLPSFRPYDTRPRAGGFIDGRFMTGIKPQEFFYHCMAGREGLIDTAVKTSRSGYLQRCLVKLLEGLVVNYDQTVRDSCDGSVIQFQYGEDGLDVCKSQYLNKGQFDFLRNNMAAIYDEKAIERAKNAGQSESKIVKYKKSVAKAKSRLDQEGKGSSRTNGFLKYCAKHDDSGFDHLIKKDTGRPLKAVRLERNWRDNLDDEKKEKYIKKAAPLPNPVTEKFRPDSNFGSVTETVDAMIESYEKADGQFKDMLYMKFMQAMVDPGEPVGVLAAQSVGEPSTQMTLNTFHFAGRGDMNVTLGIPRLREILMVASANIKTPSLTIPFLPEVPEKTKESLRIKLNRVTLANVLEKVDVKETVQLSGSSNRRRLVTLRFQFLPRKSYKSKFAVNPKMILDYVEKTFIAKKFMTVLSAVIKEKMVSIESGTDKKSGKGKKKDEEEDETGGSGDRAMDQLEKGGVGEGHASSDEEDLADDADATEARKKSRQMDDDFEEGLSDEEQELVNKLNEELGDEPEEIDIDGDGKVNVHAQDPDPGFESMDEESNDSSNAKTFSRDEIEERNMASADAQKRRTFVLNLLQSKGGTASVIDYTYDTESELWCQITMAFSVSQKSVDMSNVIRKAAEKAVLREVKNITRAFLIKNEKGEMVLTTEGANIEAMFVYENILDLSRLRCNNIHDMARYYGIEAANKTIVSEIVNVFRAYGITVNPRHLSMIADYMTFDGTYKPFNRIGIENNPSPLQQMTFETAVPFLRAATLAGKADTLDSPSSCIVVGKPFKGGTGTFRVMQNLMAEIKERNY